MIKISAILFLLLTTCSEEAKFYGNTQSEEASPVVPFPGGEDQSPDVAPVPDQKPGQDCEEDLQELKYKYRLLYRRYRHHMKKYHYDH